MKSLVIVLIIIALLVISCSKNEINLDTQGVSKNKKTCNPEELIKKNNITKLFDGSIDLINHEFTRNNSEVRNITEEYESFSGSFTKKYSRECLVIALIDGHFSHVDGYGLKIALYFNSDGKFINEEFIGTFESNNILKVFDMDNDGFSEIVYDEGCCLQGCFRNLIISKGNFENRIIKYLIEYTYPIEYNNESVQYNCKYDIKGNSLIFNSIFQYTKEQTYNGNSEKPDREERFTDEFVLENGKFVHKKGSIPDMDEYFMRFKFQDSECF